MRRLLTTLAFITLGAVSAAPASARDLTVGSADGTLLRAHFYPAPNATAAAPAPTVIVAANWSFPGDTNPDGNTSDVIGASVLRSAGFNVMTYDPRGFASSGGTAMFDSPGAEGRDVQAIISAVAQQPEAKLDAPGDPRVGMSGTEYGGAIQLIAASIDHRLDAIVPDEAWNYLPEAYFRSGAVKAQFPVFCDVALGKPTPVGTPLPPASIATKFDSHIADACNSADATGTVSAADVSYFAGIGPGANVDNIRTPTLLLQGTVDALYPPGQTLANYIRLHANNVPVKMFWYCGGHGPCRGGGKDLDTVRKVGLRWLNRWLRPNDKVQTGPAFEWVSDDGIQRSGPGYPLASLDSLSAASFGQLTVHDQGRGTRPTFAVPGTDVVNATFPSVTDAIGVDVLGEPSIRLTYKGTATPAQTFLYAQIVDARANRVVGNQVTPIPVTLDGQGHTITLPMEVIAAHLLPSMIYRVQVTPSSPVYTQQRSVGKVDQMTLEAALPLVDATKSGTTGG
jgi:ABC-2 type transport system ATP-binding protein